MNAEIGGTLIHYLPMIIGYAILIVQLAFFNDRFYETVQLAHELRVGGLRAYFGPFSDKWILLAYPFHVLLYVF